MISFVNRNTKRKEKTGGSLTTCRFYFDVSIISSELKNQFFYNQLAAKTLKRDL